MNRMSLGRAFLGAALLVGFLAASQTAEAQEYKIGFIDSERIFAEYRGTKDAQDEFNKELERLSAELETKKRDLEKMVEDYEGQALILSEPRRREREAEIQTKRAELDEFVRQIWGPSGKVAQRNEELTRPIIEKMNLVLTKIGEDEAFSIIFDAADGNVVYADRALDLTDRVLQALHADQ